MARKPTLVPCPHCSGTGWREITGVYRETYEMLRKFSGEDPNGAQLARLMDVPATAMNNRLTVMERLGMVVGTRNGREKLWRAKP